jgi:hypothetical protein
LAIARTQPGVAEAQDGGGDPAFAEAGDEGPLEAEATDERGDVVSEDVEGHGATGVHGPAGAAGVGRDDSEMV